MVSSELPEILSMSDRIAVFKKGTILLFLTETKLVKRNYCNWHPSS